MRSYYDVLFSRLFLIIMAFLFLVIQFYDLKDEIFIATECSLFEFVCFFGWLVGWLVVFVFLVPSQVFLYVYAYIIYVLMYIDKNDIGK